MMTASVSATLPVMIPRSAQAALIGWADNPAIVALIFAFKASFAGLLALFIVFWLGLDEPKWALFTDVH